MRKINVGDTIKVIDCSWNKKLLYATGRVVTIDKVTMEYGIDFFVEMDELHKLNGVLPKHTGYWLPERHIRLEKKIAFTDTNTNTYHCCNNTFTFSKYSDSSLSCETCGCIYDYYGPMTSITSSYLVRKDYDTFVKNEVKINKQSNKRKLLLV